MRIGISLALTRQVAVAAAVAGATFTMTQLPYAGQNFQRTSQSGGLYNKGQANVVVPVAVTAAGAITARVVDASGTVLQTSVVAPAATTGTTSVIVPVPARLGWGTIDLSGDGGATWKTGTTMIGAGDINLLAGQSLAAYMFVANDATTRQSVTPVDAYTPYLSMFGTYQGGSGIPQTAWPAGNSTSNAAGIGGVSWETFTGTTNYTSPTGWRILRDLAAYSGVNQSLVGNAISGTPIAQWQAGQPNNTQLRTVMTAAGNSFARMLWYQGHEDNTVTQPATSYSTALGTLLSPLMTYVIGGYANLYVGGIPNQSSRTRYTPEIGFNPIRLAQLTYANTNGATFVDPRGVTLLSDGIHESGVGGGVMGQYLARAVRPALGLSGNHLGPSLNGATVTRSGAVITITPTLPTGATALAIVGSASELRRMFRVYISGTRVNAYPLASIALAAGNTQIVVTLKVDPGVGQALDLYYGYANPSNEADIIVDNHIEADEAAAGVTVGRQLQSSINGATGAHAPLTIAAPTPGGATQAPKSWDLEVLTTPTYVNVSKFGTQSLQSGVLRNGFSPLGGPVTYEAWINISSLSLFTFVIGHVLNLAVNTDGSLRISYDSATTLNSAAGVVTADNAWHHVRLTYDGAGTNTAALWLDGVQVVTGSQTGVGYTRLGDAPLAINGDYSGARTGSGIKICEVAIWPSVLNTAAFTPPATRYTGSEGMSQLYHLDGDGLDSAVH